MACNCIHHREDIEQDKQTIDKLRKLFIKRMTEDSETTDRRRKEYNQAIFFYDDKGEYRAVFADTSMEMVLKCFDDAVKDYRKLYCDVENCTRK